MKTISLKDSVSEIVDNRGKTCPTVETGMALIATNCVKSSSLYVSKERVRYVDNKTYNEFFRGHPIPGDLIFVTKGSPGEVCMVPDEVDFCIAQDMVALRPNSEIIYPKYLFAVLRSKETKMKIRNLHVGSLIPHFKKSDFDRLELPLLDKSKQIFIGDFYYSVSKKIDLNQKMNETLEEIAKALFKSWFIDFDPVRAKSEGNSTGLSKEISDLFPDSFEDSELGKIPRGWSISVIKDIATKISDKYKKDEDWSKEKLIDLSRMPSNSIALNSYGKGDQLSTSVCKFQKYDFLFGSIRPYFYKAGICPFDGVSNTSVFILRANKIFDREFMYFYSSSMNTFKKSVQYSGGTKMPIIKWSDFKEFKFASPNKELREHFSSKIKPIVDKIISNIEEEEVLTKLRDLLLPKLISGEIKISEAESLIEEASI